MRPLLSDKYSWHCYRALFSIDELFGIQLNIRGFNYLVFTDNTKQLGYKTVTSTTGIKLNALI